MAIFKGFESDENLDRSGRFTPKRCKSNNGLDKISRFDRYVDTSYEVTVEDTAKLKVDRIDRL